MKSIKTPNHPAYHPLILRSMSSRTVQFLVICVQKLSIFIYLSMVINVANKLAASEKTIATYPVSTTVEEVAVVDKEKEITTVEL